MKLVFTEKEFDVLRKFQDKLAKEFDSTAYVGTDYAMVMLDYSPELKAMLRPLPNVKHYEFVVKQLGCHDCKKKRVFICLESQIEFLCDECAYKRQLKAKDKKAESK
jgi:hypothetical protein